jgi:DNA polymerase-3 subunit gamma/tau
MSYEVLARKWRPQLFDEVVGQSHVTETLRNAIRSKRVAHAYVFVGPRGVGKTSIARIFAKALNCQSGKGPDPCDQCDACREIRDGRNLDVIEIDGASNNGVDQVRDLRDNVRYLPSRGPYKIYIIDEVHMLSVGAFNALLKTLEEPPEHVKFFFATTEVQKIPATILSRCQRFDLRRIATRDISSHLAKLSTQEQVNVDEDALLAIARGAEGGLRDAESALDQLIAFRGKDIKEMDVLAVFGLVSRQVLDTMARAILAGDLPTLLQQVGELDAAGKDLQRLAQELLEYFRNLLVAASGSLALAAPDTTEAQAATLQELVASSTVPRLLGVADILLELQSQIRFALSRRTLLELTLMRCARAASTASLDDVLAQLERAKAALGGVPSPASAAPAYTATPPPAPMRSAVSPAPAPAAVASAPAPEPVAAAPAGDELQLLQGQWRALVDRVGQMAPLAKGYLIDAKPMQVSATRVTLGFDPEFGSNVQKINIGRNVQAIQKALEEKLGRQVMVDFKVLGAADATSLPADHKPAAPATTAPRAPASGPAPAAAAGNPSADRGRSRQAWVEDAAVKRTLETFHGDILDIRE